MYTLHDVSTVRIYSSFSKCSKPCSLQTTDYEMIRVEGVRVWSCAGGLLALRTPGLLMISVTDYSTAIQRPNTCSFSSGVHWASALCECCMMGNSNSSFATKSCACASVTFLVGIAFWFVDSMWRGMIYLRNYINWMVGKNACIRHQYSRYISS